ncbi:hypothetical protein SAMN05421688_1088 [Poseidonocella pacifica]|uniref:Uncharacterized protein n=1 Tax=Poseidonocella pacifica TaxID=871651 RepID=A0A1I0W6P9_9RHOB|nr:hypothetical protein [Poseidonocella pacifica]SFA84449.1 hypothetical protein SAMN05421688_1088 [Poseidonocella pacifica]
MHETESGIFILPRRPQAGRKITMGVQKHFTGSMVFGDCEGQVMQFESHTEKIVALVMLARQGVAGLENQIPFPWINLDGAAATHFFDLRVSHTDGSRVALIVKNARKAAKAEFIAEMSYLASQVTSDFADRVALITEKDLDPIEVHNAELTHSVRLADPEADTAVRTVVAELTGTAKVRDIAAAAGLSGRGFLAVVRMIGKHELELEAHERIDPDVLVRRRVI